MATNPYGFDMVRTIMQCSTTAEVDAAFADFLSGGKIVSIDVFAARALKKSQLLNEDHQDSKWWWDFYDAANKQGMAAVDATRLVLRLGKEFKIGL